MPVRVGLNLVFLVPGETGGMETYARELIAAIAARDEVRLVAFVNRETADAGHAPFPGANETLILPVRARRRVQWVRGEQQLLPPHARRARVDLVHSLASTGPAWGDFRRVTTIHDLHYLLHPGTHFRARALGMRVLVPLAARRSDRVIVPSQSTADDVTRYLGLSRQRLDVVPEGVGASASAAPLPEPEVRDRLGAPPDRPLVLSVSAKRPHKNLSRLLDALAAIPAERRPLLVLPGYPTAHERTLRRHAADLGIDGDVRWLGWVDPPLLEGLYAASACFVLPSLHEGFGLPVLEAMARGLPVACSAGGALTEVVDDAALLFDPRSHTSIAAALERLLGDGAEADRLRSAGRARAACFTWEAAAAATIASYERALASPRGAGD